MAIKKNRTENREIATRSHQLLGTLFRHTAYYRHSDFIKTTSISLLFCI